MKVETKMMAFDDSTPTAPDRITGQKNIVAFRACALKNNTDCNHNHSESTPGTSCTVDVNELYLKYRIHIELKSRFPSQMARN